jgi:hypothetical protein
MFVSVGLWLAIVVGNGVLGGLLADALARKLHWDARRCDSMALSSASVLWLLHWTAAEHVLQGFGWGRVARITSLVGADLLAVGIAKLRRDSGA